MTLSAKKTDDDSEKEANIYHHPSSHSDLVVGNQEPQKHPIDRGNEENHSSGFKEVRPSEKSSDDGSKWVQPDPFLEPTKSGREKYEERHGPVDEEEDDTSKKDTSGVLSRPSNWNNSSRGVRSRLKDDVEDFADDYLASGKPINRRNVRSAANNHFGAGHPHDVGELKELLEYLE